MSGLPDDSDGSDDSASALPRF
eukprot:COSAG01_NODE_56925_length_315_cov_1.041667_1_plen_21_part_10